MPGLAGQPAILAGYWAKKQAICAGSDKRSDRIAAGLDRPRRDMALLCLNFDLAWRAATSVLTLPLAPLARQVGARRRRRKM